MTLVIPAYNEEQRLGSMLKEAVEYLELEYPFDNKPSPQKVQTNGHATKPGAHSRIKGWEIILVSDGSTDKTVDVTLNYARELLPTSPAAAKAIRVVQLAYNRGKGGAVVHGLRHARGAYALFADADGATTFSGLGQLVPACEKAAASDSAGHGRGVAIGSRAHLVGSAAVVQRSFLRNLLMYSFHLFIRLFTPPATGRVRDTQCGFKLFSRSALPFIVPYMHSEGWIFDVEMLMLAESAGVEVAEVPVGWHEVLGSKLNVIRDSLAMAWGLAILRVAWGIGVYRRW
jgi:dolichyl-phosphate beta-glucosyltransferase